MQQCCRATDVQFFILFNEAVLRVKTNGDTKNCYAYLGTICTNSQLVVTIVLKVIFLMKSEEEAALKCLTSVSSVAVW